MRTKQAFTRDGFLDQPIHHALQRICHRLGWDGAGRIIKCRKQDRDGALRDHGPRGIMDQHKIRRLRGDGRQTRTYAFFPCRAACHHRQAGQPLQKAGDKRFLAGRGDRLQGCHQPFGQKRFGRMAQHGATQ